MTRVALTGGTGFVGANLTRALVARGAEVHLLNRERFNAWRIHEILKDVSLHVIDLTDATATDALVRALRPQQIFHLAQYGGYSWQLDTDTMIRTNYLAGVNLLRAAHKVDVSVFVNTGSSSEYGLKRQPSLETDRLEPNSDYAATKAAFTLYSWQLARRAGRVTPTLRLYSVYGPFEEPSRLIPRLLLCALEGRWPPLVAPHTARDFVYIEDVVDAYLRVAADQLAEPGRAYNICSGQQTTLQQLVQVVRTMLNIDVEPRWNTMAGRSWDTDTWCGDSSRAAAELGWRATIGLESGLRKFAHWLQQEPRMWEYYHEKLQSVPAGNG